MLGTANDSTILRLRVRGSNLDPLALRGRLQNLLGEMSFQSRLPPAATLFIRKLNDPMPGLLHLDTSYPRAPEPWRHAFNTRFEQLVSTAARPAHGSVNDSAESVVFYDYSELLASLSADWSSGAASTRWWWQALIKRGDVSQLIKQLWREKIEYAPAALEQLAKRNELVEFVSRLSDDETRELVQRVVHVFALHEMRRVLERSPMSEPRITRMEDADLSLEYRPVEAARVRSLMPWRYTVPESDTPRLRPAQQLFVGLGLMIRRAPSRVRTLSFAKEVEHWQEQVSNLWEVGQPEGLFERAVSDEPQNPAPILVEEVVVATSTSARESTPRDPIAPVFDEPEREEVKIGHAVFRQEERVSISKIDLETSNEATTASDEQPVYSDPPGEPVQQVSTMPSEPLESVTIETKLGGLFYLINLAIFLNIYSDFTSPSERVTTDLSIWDFVALVGADLDEYRDQDDPVWSLLRTGLQDLQGFQDLQDKNPVNPVNKPAWLIDLLPHLRTRLRRALGIDDQADLAQILLHHHARVISTATHLDVFFSLAEHPIEIRLSGLDRNPGWVPAAGRFIAFHYD